MTTLYEQLTNMLEEFQGSISTSTGEWSVKGFIDVYRNIYSISTDTKVVSKIIEIMLFPIIARFAQQHNYQLILSEHQNHYPDLTFIAPDATKIRPRSKKYIPTQFNDRQWLYPEVVYWLFSTARSEKEHYVSLSGLFPTPGPRSDL